MGTAAQTIDIRCLQLLLDVWSMNSMHSARLSVALQSALIMVGMKGIRLYFIESSSMVGSILSQARKERLGNSEMTADTFEPGIKLCLARKGVTQDADIQKIEELGGTLTRGLLMVLHALPRQNPDNQIMPLLQRSRRSNNPGKKRVRVHEKIDPEKFKAMKEIVHDRVEKREQGFSRHLSSLPSDVPGLAESHQARSTEENQHQVAIESFLQLGNKEAGSVAEIQYLLADQDPFSSGHDLLSTSYCEPQIDDLVPVIEDVIKIGFPGSATDTASALKDAASKKFPRKRNIQNATVRPPNMAK